MKTQGTGQLTRILNQLGGGVAAFGLLALGGASARASVAYGSINNFDTVNDTGEPCHGFEIELDDCTSRDVTYCYDYNHYGTPNIREDTTSVPGHTNCFVRYAAILTNGVWSAYTAVPTNPIAPTDGHQFTNPSLNFGGEHFGVGYYGNPSAIKYNWLLDDGFGSLVHGPPVVVATPTFTYYPPAGGLPGQVQAVVEPAIPEVPVWEFGPASWVKSIVTSSHTNREIKLRDLVSDDPDHPGDKSWRNGEQDEVESEWDLLQAEFGNGGGGGGGGGGHGGGGGGGPLAVVGQAEDLNHGDEIITRRYEFYAYIGPIDPGTGEAMADKVGPDGIHGINTYSNTIIVGDYLGAQMSAFDNELPIGLIDHVADGEINVEYPARTMVIAGTPFTATNTGVLPDGMTFDQTAGVLSGTPTESGVFTFTVRGTTTNQPAIEKSYTFAVIDPNDVPLPHSTVDTVASPLDCGNTSGTGLYTNGDTCTITAAARPGFRFAKWTDNGAVASTAPTLQFPVTLNRSLVAVFVPAPPELKPVVASANSLTVAWPTNATGCVLQQITSLGATNWATVTNPVTVVGTNNRVTIPTGPGSRFFRLKLP